MVASEEGERHSSEAQRYFFLLPHIFQEHVSGNRYLKLSGDEEICCELSLEQKSKWHFNSVASSLSHPELMPEHWLNQVLAAVEESCPRRNYSSLCIHWIRNSCQGLGSLTLISLGSNPLPSFILLNKLSSTDISQTSLIFHSPIPCQMSIKTHNNTQLVPTLCKQQCDYTRPLPALQPAPLGMEINSAALTGDGVHCNTLPTPCLTPFYYVCFAVYCSNDCGEYQPGQQGQRRVFFDGGWKTSPYFGSLALSSKYDQWMVELVSLRLSIKAC